VQLVQFSMRLISWAPSPGVERPGREADQSLAPSADVKITWCLIN
jgi:hypothetical protein